MWSRLPDAIKRNDLGKVRRYFELEPDCVTERNQKNETPLHLAAEAGSREVTQEILSFQVPLDPFDDAGWTPLHRACGNGHEEVVAMLLEAGADRESVSKRHETPLQVAIANGFEKIVARLLISGANHKVRDKRGDTPLHSAAKRGLNTIVQILLDNGAGINSRNFHGATPLHLASEHGYLETVHLLLSKGAKPTSRDNRRRTFLEVATRAHKRHFAEHFTRDPGASGNQPGKTGLGGNSNLPNLPPAVVKEIQGMVSVGGETGQPWVNAFLYGLGEGKAQYALLELLDSLLWFFGFPFLIFVLWAGFYLKIIPTLLSFAHVSQGDSLILLSQTLLNTILVIILSSWLVETEKGEIPLSHVLMYQRENIRIRICQFLFIDAFFIEKLSFDLAFWKMFAPFWFGCFLVYAGSFAFWWSDTRVEVETDKVPSPRPDLSYASTKPLQESHSLPPF